MRNNWYDEEEDVKKIFVTGGAMIGAAIGLFAPAIITYKALGYIIDKVADRSGKKKLVEMIIKNPEMADTFKGLVKKYNEGSLTMSEGEKNEYVVRLLKEIGIDKIKSVAEEELAKVPEIKKGEIMKEDLKQKEMRLKKELARVKAQNSAERRTTTKSRDFSVGGLPPDTTHKAIRTSKDVPDVILHPSNRRGKKENIPF
tara:strand:- start:226 stop:825 length:600 start_codon:yes stop_codon:yes gene_type:complete